MARIISISPKLAQVRRRERSRRHRDKIAAVRKVLQCTHCSLKCEKCGTGIAAESAAVPDPLPGLPATCRLCDSCRQEYADYRERREGRGDPDCYWHNADWTAAWKRWTEYRSAMERYLNSGEFRELIREVREGADE